MSTIETKPTVGTTTPTLDIDEGDHEKMTHIVIPAAAVTEAMVMGTPLTALCGRVWVPSRDPERFPVCPTCIEVFEARTGHRWTGRR